MAVDRIKFVHFEDSAIGLIQKTSDRLFQQPIALGAKDAKISRDDLWMDFEIEALVNKRTRKFPCQFLICDNAGDYSVQVRTFCRGEAVKGLQALLDQEEKGIVAAILEHLAGTFTRWEDRLGQGEIDG